MGGRIRFANQLRGIAALSVALVHLIGVYWAAPDLVSAVTFSPPQQGPKPWEFYLIFYQWFNLGPFGVALFFLISGMVIPFSLQRHSRAGFLLARAMRIYPTYVAALLLQLLMLYAAAHAWGRPFTVSMQTIVLNAALVFDMFGDRSLDLVNWTLSVEIGFYLLAALAGPLILRGKPGPLVAVAGAVLAANLVVAYALAGALPTDGLLHALGTQFVYIQYMLLGVAFNLHLRGLVTTATLAGLIVVLSGLFVAGVQFSVVRDQYPWTTANYGYALGLFTVLYAVRRFVPSNAVLDGMASISFPFYVIHSLTGYSLLRMLMLGAGLPYGAALTSTLLLLTVLAACLHLAVERPTLRLSKKIGQSSRLRAVYNDV